MYPSKSRVPRERTNGIKLEGNSSIKVTRISPHPCFETEMKFRYVNGTKSLPRMLLADALIGFHSTEVEGTEL